MPEERRPKSVPAAKRRPTKSTKPSRRPERALSRKLGGALVAGVDEVGRGPLAGPVVAAAVIWPDNRIPPKGLNDSKLVLPHIRTKIFHSILARATSVGVGIATAREIDRINIYKASRLAALRALDGLSIKPGAVLTDCMPLPDYPVPVQSLVGGDRKSVCIAAASIVAKVIRDRLMEHYALEYPGYHWETNRGYTTQEHIEAITRFGPTTLHRLHFTGVSFFTEHLNPSRTLRALWEEDRETLLRYSEVLPPAMASSWTLTFPLGDLSPREFAPYVLPLLSKKWSAEHLRDHALVFLDEQERHALKERLRAPGHVPSWWPPAEREQVSVVVEEEVLESTEEEFSAEEAEGGTGLEGKPPADENTASMRNSTQQNLVKD